MTRCEETRPEAAFHLQQCFQAASESHRLSGGVLFAVVTMGFFDRLANGKPLSNNPGGEKPAIAGGIMPLLAEARTKLDAKDLLGAVAIYEHVLAAASARPDVLVTISGDLGVHGHVKELIELVAPHYDAAKHGPATGLNLLQAFLVTRNIEPAQHLLDILFSLQRPELEERLFGFSNALADLMAGSVPVDDVAAAAAASGEIPEMIKVSLASISKPIWFYGLEAITPPLLPRKEGKLRRVAFAQCALPGIKNAEELSAQPEDAMGRLTRGLPLWFAETFTFGAGYDPIAAIGASNQKKYAVFGAEWTAENIRQLIDSSKEVIDYVVTGALRNRNEDIELIMRIWEVKKFRELKQFSTRWTPATADEALRLFHEQLRLYMEWTPLPAGNGLAYAAPASPYAYVQALGASLTLFLGEKGVLAAEQMNPVAADFLPAAQDTGGHLTLLTALQRLQSRGVAVDETALTHIRTWLASDEAKTAGVAGISL